jgi:hypothetical protein
MKACADTEQKRLKRQWWNEHGEEQRRKHAKGKRGHKPPMPKRKQR